MDDKIFKTEILMPSDLYLICIRVFSYKQCTSSLPLFQHNKQTHEVDGMKRFLATVPFFSQMVHETTLGSGRRLNTKRGSCKV